MSWHGELFNYILSTIAYIVSYAKSGGGGLGKREKIDSYINGPWCISKIYVYIMQGDIWIVPCIEESITLTQIEYKCICICCNLN